MSRTKHLHRFKHLFAAFMILAGTFATVSPAQPVFAATTRYVAVGGVDSGDCSSSGSPCATITYANSQAVSGDTLSLAAGIYTENNIALIDGITLTGAGAETTIVQANAFPDSGVGPVFWVLSNSNISYTLEHITIRHGDVYNNIEVAGAGGLGVLGGSSAIIAITLNDVVLSENSPAGIYYYDSHKHATGIDSGSLITLNNSIVTHNERGIFSNYGSIALNNTVVSDNHLEKPGHGAGIRSDNGLLTLNNSTVNNNRTDVQLNNFGGGIYSYYSSITIIDSTISNNWASSGGGIYNASGTLTIENSLVNGNRARSGAGIVQAYSVASLVLNNSTITGNLAEADAGGIMAALGTAFINYSTITNNISNTDGDASGQGGGIYNLVAGAVTLKNSIVAGNKNGTSVMSAASDCSGPVTSEGYNLTGSNTGCNFSGTGDLTIDPALVFPGVLKQLADNGGPTQTHAISVNNSNTALDAIPDGVNDCGSSAFNTDQRGELRPFNLNCDIGAYEAQTLLPEPVMRYAAVGGTDDSHCADSNDPCATITYAISQAGAGDTIEIAAGIYTEAGIIVDKDLILKGAGAANTIVQAAATKDAAIDRVFKINVDATATIEDLTVRHGNPADPDDIGGGILNNGSLTLNNCTITQNSATDYGGGLHNSGKMFLDNCTVNSNTSGYGGGGIYNVQFGIVKLTNSLLSNNSAGHGGALASDQGTLTLTDTSITGNTAQAGGGFYVGHGAMTINNGVISNNSATNGGGGGFYAFLTELTLNNSKITGNTADVRGGGFFSSAVTTLNNSIVSGNSSNYFGGGIYTDFGTLILNTTTVSGNSVLDYGGGLYVVGIPVTLNYSTVANNISDSDGNGVGNGGGLYTDGYYLKLKNSVIAGNRNGTSGIADPTADCSNAANSLGYNLTGSGAGCNLNSTGDQTIDPALVFTDVLRQLADNGGPTETHALILHAGNPAINTIPNGINDCGLLPFDLDQRGEPRPAALTNTGCDIGAFESQVEFEPNPARVAGDFDGDWISDPALYYNNGIWSWLTSSSGFSTVVSSPAFNTGGGAVPQLGNDFDGDGKTDPTMYHPDWGLLYWRLSTTGAQGTFGYFTSTAHPVAIAANDYDGDGKSDPALYYPASGIWSWKNSSDDTSSVAAFNPAGNPTPIAGADLNGDGKSDPALFYAGTGLFAWNANGTVGTAAFNPAGNPVPFLADFDGDGKSDPALYYQTWALWAWRRSSDGQPGLAPFNAAGNPQPVVGFFDEDNKADAGLYYANLGLWAWQRSSDEQIGTAAYNPGGNPEPQFGNDFDGDGKADPALYYRTWGLWAWKRSSDGQAGLAPYGPNGNPAVIGGLDFDGDGKTDPGLYYRDYGLWAWQKSTDGTVITRNMPGSGSPQPVR